MSAPAQRPQGRLRELLDAALADLGEVTTRFDPGRGEALVEELVAARRVVVHGVGREGLMMRAFAMRLFHAGLDVHVAGDVTAPRIGAGDLLVVSSGPGGLATVHALMRVGQEAGARALVVTAQPGSETARAADAVVHLPAPTMAEDGASPAPSLPMGSLFEIAQLVYFDCVAQVLSERSGRSGAELRERHTNLE